jgi:hypothetical protein
VKSPAQRPGFFANFFKVGLLSGFALGFPIFISEWRFGGVLRARKSASSRRRAVSCSLNFSGSSLMPTTPRVTRLSIARARKAFDPFAKEIGHLTRAWNMLHDDLGLIFARLINPANPNIGRAVWHSIRSDLAQREAIKAASLASFAIDKKIHPKAGDDIQWCVSACNFDPLRWGTGVQN